MSRPYTIEELTGELRKREKEQFFGELTFLYQAGEVNAFKVWSLNKPAEEETIRRQKDVSRGRMGK